MEKPPKANGAGIFATSIREIKARMPDTRVEVLIPDFKGERAPLETVLDARPDVLNHNTETVPRLYRMARSGGKYTRTLELLADSWKVIFDTGEISIDQPANGRCTLSIVDPTYSPLHAWISAGYTQRACERAGGKNVRADITGQPPRVDLTITWV